MAYPDRIASAKRGNNAQFQLSNGSIAAIGHKDELADESWLTVANMDARGGMGKIFLAAPLNPKDLMPLVKNQRNVQWDFEEDEFIVSNDLSIGNITLKREELDDEPNAKEKRKAIIKAIHLHYDEILNVKDDFFNYLEEIKENKIETEYSELDLAFMGITAEKWLPEGIEDEADIFNYLQRLSLKEILKELIKS